MTTPALFERETELPGRRWEEGLRGGVGRRASLDEIEIEAISRFARHCEERSGEAIESNGAAPGLLRFARNDAGTQ
jgi:hypothetical protein